MQFKSSSQKYSVNSGSKINGWILDLYPGKPGEMVVWIKTKNCGCFKIIDHWSPYFYISATSQADLTRLARHLHQNINDIQVELVEKLIDLQDDKRLKVLKVTIPDLSHLRSMAKTIWRLGDYKKYRLWSVDIPLPQMYLNDKNLFPLAYVQASIRDREVSWMLMDSAQRLEYPVPPLKITKLNVEIAKEGIVPGFNDPISQILLKFSDRLVAIDSADEGEKILRLVKALQDNDPDIIVTHRGDSFLFTYLARRALENKLLPKLVLGREKTDISVSTGKGNTYFSYGRIYYKSTPQKLLGRLHIDHENSGFYAHYGLEALMEVSRTCRIPLHRASRVSIGTCMTAIQIHQAVSDGFLIPWKKSEPENFKSAMDLLVADRGGFYFEPKVGIHDNVGEIDFSSMYPMLMLNKNISPETIGCECCLDSSNRVPELGYNICEKRVGIVPKVLELMLEKRLYYKKMRNKARNTEEKKRYDQRQAAYKIILCTCFGYLGYRNARFGKVDAHIAACAFARKTLLDTAKIAERRGFEIVHGIVDSLYLKREEASDRNFIELCKMITGKTELPISYEGRYRWIVFLPSKTHFGVPVLNRFYGAFQNGEIKARGIELRRRDTPKIVKQCQTEILKLLSKAKNSHMFFRRLPDTVSVLRKYINKILNGKVEIEDLLITKQLSKNPCQYINNVHQAIAARQLLDHGIQVTAGQTIRYVILDADNRRPERRVLAAQLIDEHNRYDSATYAEFLDEALRNILSPFILKGNRLVKSLPRQCRLDPNSRFLVEAARNL